MTINREIKARKKLEEKLKEVIVKFAEKNDPKWKYKAEFINRELSPVVEDEKAYKFVVYEPMQDQIDLKVEEGTMSEGEWEYIYKDEDIAKKRKQELTEQEKWSNLILKLKIIEGKAFKTIATTKELKELHKKIYTITQDIVDLNLSLELEDLTFEAQFAREKVKNIIAERQAKMKSSKYPDELVTITSHLVDFWWNELEVEINAYSKGNTYDRSGIKDDVAKENLKTIDIKYNPGGAFLQRALKVYFKQDLDNTQLKTLLSKVKKKVR